MKALRLVLAGALILIGAVWFGQGVGWIGGSFMTGSAVWAVIGALCVAGGVLCSVAPRCAAADRRRCPSARLVEDAFDDPACRVV